MFRHLYTISQQSHKSAPTADAAMGGKGQTPRHPADAINRVPTHALVNPVARKRNHECRILFLVTLLVTFKRRIISTMKRREDGTSSNGRRRHADYWEMDNQGTAP